MFLDEFQNATLEVQAQLLDLLSPVSNKVSISRMGEEETSIDVDVKVIFAINEPIDELLENKIMEKK